MANFFSRYWSCPNENHSTRLVERANVTPTFLLFETWTTNQSGGSALSNLLPAQHTFSSKLSVNPKFTEYK